VATLAPGYTLVMSTTMHAPRPLLEVPPRPLLEVPGQIPPHPTTPDLPTDPVPPAPTPQPPIPTPDPVPPTPTPTPSPEPGPPPPGGPDAPPQPQI
jgi:hypothetical protein